MRIKMGLIVEFILIDVPPVLDDKVVFDEQSDY
jgi:hypothetical protein